MFSSSTALAQSAPASEALLGAYRSAFESGDVDAIVTLFTSDAELIDGASVASGTGEIRSLYHAAFAAGLSGSNLETRIDRDSQLARGIRFVRGVSRISPMAPGEPFCARFVATIGAREGHWRIITFSEAALACAKAFP
ncbi:MAG: hypothetical protein B7Y45_13960 [Sphingomonas sp. 28-66-16]|nr:MAG: hypothetical protein B7Y45_13960 [Sphingomonas sp. 28-66-16]